MKKTNIFYFFVIPGLFIQLIGSYIYFIAFDGMAIAHIPYTLTKILVLVWPIVWILYKWKHSKDREQKRHRQASLLLGGVFGIFVTFLMFFILANWYGYFTSFSGVIQSKASDLNVLNHFVFFALFLSIIHSAIEEYYWRWFIFGGLQIKLSPVKAAIIASIGFTSHHVIILSQFFDIGITMLFSLGVFLGGLVWCYIYKKTNSLLGSWISHVLVDLAIMSIGYILIFM